MQPNLIFNPTEGVSRSAAGLVAAVVPAEISMAHLRTTCPHKEVGPPEKVHQVQSNITGPAGITGTCVKY